MKTQRFFRLGRSKKCSKGIVKSPISAWIWQPVLSLSKGYRRANLDLLRLALALALLVTLSQVSKVNTADAGSSAHYDVQHPGFELEGAATDVADAFRQSASAQATISISGIETSSINHGNPITITGSGFGTKISAAPFRSSYMHPNGEQNFQESGSFDASYWSTWNLVSLQDSMRRVDDQTSHSHYVKVEYREGGTGSGVRVHSLPMTGKDYFAWWDYFAPGFEPANMHTGCAAFKYIYLNAGGHPHMGLQVMQNAKFYGSASGGVAGDTREEQDANLVLPFGGGYYGRPISWVADYTLPIGEWYFVELVYDINSAPGIQDGWMEFRINNELIWRANNIDIFDPGYTNDPGFEDIALGGNYGWDGGSDVYYRYYGDIYIDDSFARVAIGDSQNYDDCDHLELQIPTAWSDNSITFTLNQGSFQDGETVYLFVFDEENNHNEIGYPLHLGEPVEELILHGAPADETIHLTWTVNTTLPVTSTWQIAYDGPAGDRPSPITSIVSPTRAYTLTGLTNYTWYTVTLNATVDSTPFLTDTVRVMPSDIFVYLPIVLNAP